MWNREPLFQLCQAEDAARHFSFEMTIESFLEGHVCAFEYLGGVPRECVYDNRTRSSSAKLGRKRRTWSSNHAGVAYVRRVRSIPSAHWTGDRIRPEQVNRAIDDDSNE